MQRSKADSDDDVVSAAEGHSEVITDDDKFEGQLQDAEDLEIIRQNIPNWLLINKCWARAKITERTTTSVFWYQTF